jgi:hypothetical protein
MITLVDSNVILDLITDDPNWFRWSSEALSRAADESSLAINPLIFAEVSIGFTTVEKLDHLLPPEDFARLDLPYEAAFSPAKLSLLTSEEAAEGALPWPTFTSTPTRPWPVCAF